MWHKIECELIIILVFIEAPFDDTMTEMDIGMSANESGQNRTDRAKNEEKDALRISRRRATMVVENLSKSTNEVKQKDANFNLRHEHTASRIKTRRATKPTSDKHSSTYAKPSHTKH